MSALPFTPLTITPRPAASPHAHSPSQREGAGGRAASDSDAAPLLPSSLDPLHFHPDATTASTIINELASNDLTLLDIADRHDTTLEALTLWMTRPDIAQRLSALESACARRARLTVANSLNAIANTLLHLLAEAKDDHASVHRVPAATHHAFAARMQSRESARKAANLLLRIARYTPLADNAPPTPHDPKNKPTHERVVFDAPLAPSPRSAQPSAATPHTITAPLAVSQPPTPIPILRVAKSPTHPRPTRTISRAAPQDHPGPQPPAPAQYHPP